MLRQLLESDASRPQRAPWTLASAVLHAALVTGAVVLTLPRGAPTVVQPQRDVGPVFVRTVPEAPPSHLPAAGSVPRAVAMPVDVHIPVPRIPGLEVEVVAAPAMDATSLWRDMVPERGASGGRGDEIYSRATVDRSVIARPGNGSPDYPVALRVAGVEGDVVVRFVVDTTGRVEPGSLVVVRATHASFGRAVERWLAGTRYEPARLNGRAVRQMVEQRAGFTLRR